jgi:hypothetical protein
LAIDAFFVDGTRPIETDDARDVTRLCAGLRTKMFCALDRP